MKFARITRRARSAKHECLIPSTKDVHREETNRSKDREKTGDEETTIQYNTIQYNTLFNHATFRSEKRSLKHVRAKNNVYN